MLGPWFRPAEGAGHKPRSGRDSSGIAQAKISPSKPMLKHAKETPALHM